MLRSSRWKLGERGKGGVEDNSIRRRVYAVPGGDARADARDGHDAVIKLATRLRSRRKSCRLRVRTAAGVGPASRRVPRGSDSIMLCAPRDATPSPHQAQQRERTRPSAPIPIVRGVRFDPWRDRRIPDRHSAGNVSEQAASGHDNMGKRVSTGDHLASERRRGYAHDQPEDDQRHVALRRSCNAHDVVEAHHDVGHQYRPHCGQKRSLP